MSISIRRVVNISDSERINQGSVQWAVWSGNPNIAPSESGTGISTNSSGELTIPCVATAGIFALRVSDTLMGLYKTP